MCTWVCVWAAFTHTHTHTRFFNIHVFSLVKTRSRTFWLYTHCSVHVHFFLALSLHLIFFFFLIVFQSNCQWHTPLWASLAHLPISSRLPQATYAGTEGLLALGRRAARGEEVVAVETTPINRLINHNWPIYIFATYSQLSFIYANPEKAGGSGEEDVGTKAEPVGCRKIKLELYSDLCGC